MDNVDIRILNILQENAKTPNSEIARQIGMAPSGVLERIRKIEKRQLVRGYHAVLNEKNVGFPLLAYVFLSTNTPNWNDTITKKLSKLPIVQELHEVAGSMSYMLKVRVRDTDHLSEVLKKDLGSIEGIESTKTTIVLKSVKETSDLPIEATKKKSRKRPSK
jgi:Lrp/AsnC family leucine-responsive transcriptional regulator